jgi:peptide-methionine (R)-S-oxide reductase
MNPTDGGGEGRRRHFSGDFMTFTRTALLIALAALIWACEKSSTSVSAAPTTASSSKVEKIAKTDAEWKKLLTADQYYILREKGTEPPFHNAFWDNHKAGTYECAACGLELFTSDTKFDSGTGWPSFWDKVGDHVITTKDADGERDELLCARCGGHLGHVFDDGPRDHTGLRYCIDSGALKFVEKK